ncbi:recombinase family protein [Streptomyces sioyaensis]|uniref:recombinase family protein n=1 Tax=Streptomyces sioyaensis TaxID=67364 RepID=UPI0033F522E9
MNGEGKITTAHRSRLAIIYLRQSTMLQVRDHTESTTRQYALVDLALALGWTAENILVIDKDLGISGRFGVERGGFHEVVAKVCLAEAGAVFGLEVSRLARSNADIARLLELAGTGQATATTIALPLGVNPITATVIAEGATCTCVGVAGTATVTVGPAQGLTAQPACYTLNLPPLPWSFAHTTLTATGATPGATVTFHSDGAGGPVLCTAVADTNGNANCTANLTIFQLASGYTATTPVPGGSLTSSSTLLPCI